MEPLFLSGRNTENSGVKLDAQNARYAQCGYEMYSPRDSVVLTIELYTLVFVIKQQTLNK